MFCKCCGQEVKIPKDAIILAGGRSIEADSPRVLTCPDVSENRGEYLKEAGRNFREWWSANVATGFSDGFFNR